MSRVFISLYFPNGDLHNRKKKDVTISINSEDIIYDKCKDLSSSEIKEIIGIETYKELIERAKNEDRTVNNYVKSKLRKALFKDP